MKQFCTLILISVVLFPLSGRALEIVDEEIFQRPGTPYVDHVFLEQESIIAYFEITNIDEYKKLIPDLFVMPEKPLCMVKINNFYKMESAPPYVEAIVAILVKYKRPRTGDEVLAWHFLALSVTSEEALWGRIGGFPKVLRKVTFESSPNRYVGTSYARDGKTPVLKLVLETKKARPTADEKSFLDYVSPIPHMTIRNGKVLNRGSIGGGKYKIYELAGVAPRTWTIEFGDGSLEYPENPVNYLYRLGIGKFLAGCWLKQKARYQIQRKEE